MSRNVHDVVKLTKNGTLVCEVRDSNEDEDVVKILPITSTQLSYLINKFEIEEGATLRDLFNAISFKRGMYEEMFEQLYMKEYMAYILDNIDVEVDTSTFTEDVAVLEVYYQIDCDVLDQESGYPDISWLSNIMPSFHGKSSPNKDDGINWSIMYSDVLQMLDTPLQLSKTMQIVIPKPELPEGNGYYTLNFANPSYTLYNVIHAIMYELSWVGGPEEKKRSLKELNDLHDEYKECKNLKEEEDSEKEI